MVNGRERIQDTKAYVDAVPFALDVYNSFKKKLKIRFNQKQDFEHTTCRYIQERLYGRGFVMTDPKERDSFNAAGGHSDTGCPKVCAVAAEIAAEKIIELT